MTTRRRIREWTIQILFQLDMNPGELDAAFSAFWEGKSADRKARRFAEDLVRGVREHAAELDETISRYAEHWEVGRMGVVERNVIRLGLYEMLYREDIPPVVSINEAVDLANYFSSTESGHFVNGILDRACKDLDRPARG